jgi:hypothetical protein
MNKNGILIFNNFDISYKQLNGRIPVVIVFFNVITNIKRIERLDMIVVSVHTEGNPVHYVFGMTVDQFKLEMFLVAAYQAAGTVIKNPAGRKDRLIVVRSKGIELLEHPEKFRRNFLELYFGINIDGRGKLFQ